MVRFVRLTTDQTEIQAHKIRVIPTVCPASFLALPTHVRSPKSGVSLLTWTSSIVVCLSSEASVWEMGTFSLRDVPWSRTSGWWCSGGRERLGAGGQGCGSGFYSQDCSGDLFSLTIAIFKCTSWKTWPWIFKRLVSTRVSDLLSFCPDDCRSPRHVAVHRTSAKCLWPCQNSGWVL